ncbi:MAG: FGGY family carbohydrate kinase [Candidatus Promineifilaceae bacterium]|nr:FGGY family carbohydrate kinase [Candidatus Promineifilaceae bacterium]
MNKPYLLGIDQGTSGSRALVIDCEGKIRGYAYQPLARLYPRPDWVEQDPMVVAMGAKKVIAGALNDAGCTPDQIQAVGIAGQRNTDFGWDGYHGRPIANAITWQDLRTQPLLEEIQAWPLAAEARYRLGYAPGTYMSSLHLAWRMRHDSAVQQAAADGSLRLGLSAAWLINALGQPSEHCMDSSLVQAMGLYDFRDGQYWSEWLEALAVPQGALPEPRPTIHDFGTLRLIDQQGRTADVPVLAMIGDQQAALFGHGCRTPGTAECTQGTASFVKVFTGKEVPHQGYINIYYAWNTGHGQTYCLEAPTTVVGGAIRWMQELRLFDTYAEMDALAAELQDSGGVMFVPALTGLDTPYNDPQARGTILGLTLGTSRGHIIRSFMDSIGYQLRAILEAICQYDGTVVDDLLVGGGVTASDTACQIQANLTGIPIIRPTFKETTAFAAALLAGLGSGVWPDESSLPPAPGSRTVFEPDYKPDGRDAGYARWQEAVQLTQSWGSKS